MVSWIAGLGLGAKIALGAGVALAATAGVGAGAGAAGILPPGAQDAYNTVVSSVITNGDDTSDDAPTPDPTDAPDPTNSAHPDNFGGLVSTGAQDPDKVGRDFGSEVSDAAHENGQGAPSSMPGTDESEDSDHVGEQGKPTDVPTGGPTDIPGGKPTH